MIPEEGSILCEKPGICKFIMYDKVRVNVLPYLASSHVNIIQSGRGGLGGRGGRWLFLTKLVAYNRHTLGCAMQWSNILERVVVITLFPCSV